MNTTGNTPVANVKFFSFFHGISHIDFMSKRNFAYFFSGACILATIVIFAVIGVNFSIDFRGGLELTMRPSQNVGEDQIRTAVSNAGFKDAEVKTITDVEGNNDLLIRIKQSDAASNVQVTNSIVEAVQKQVAPVQVELRQTQSVGPKVGKELIWAALYAIAVTSILIMIYLWWRFEWIFGVGATIALVHDVFITAGFVTLLHIEFSMQILAALLTILGYSINDTIVVYDRVRENVKKMRGENIITIINRSVNETLSRTILTAGTVIMASLVLYFFGGPVVNDFAVAMLFGVTFGTYSSVFVAAAILVDSHVKDLGKAMAKKGSK